MTEAAQCDSMDCPWLFERKKIESKAEALSAIEEYVDEVQTGVYPCSDSDSEASGSETLVHGHSTDFIYEFYRNSFFILRRMGMTEMSSSKMKVTPSVKWSTLLWKKIRTTTKKEVLCESAL